MRMLVIQPQENVPLGTVAAPLEAAGVELLHWYTWFDDAPETALAFDAVIALGGSVNPDQDAEHPWLGRARGLLREAVDGRIPVLGSCLGGQLLAQVLGASVHRLAEPEIGWLTLACQRAADDRLLRHYTPFAPAFQWHSYGFGLPPDSKLLAGSSTSTQAFSFRDHAWGLQFHPEVDQSIVEGWITHYQSDLRDAGIDLVSLRGETATHITDYRRQAVALAADFLSIAAKRSVLSSVRAR